ncbi:MAG: hypothetical protein ACR2MB_17365 [Acidimicrobiales bacterium]
MATVGVIMGIGGPVVTAPVIGANIGGGLVLLFGPPLVLALLAIAAWWAGTIARSDRPQLQPEWPTPSS